MVGINETLLNTTGVEAGKGYLIGFVNQILNISKIISDMTGVQALTAIVFVSMIFGVAIQKLVLKNIGLGKIVIAVGIVLYLVGKGIIIQ